MLADGFYDVPPGRIATVVTHLAMSGRPTPGPRRASGVADGLAVRRVLAPPIAWYRDLFRRVGGDWLWFSRLGLDDAALAAILHDPRVEVYALAVQDRDEGLFELDFRASGACELAFFGLTAPVIGRGYGRALMDRAIEAAWSHPISRFWVHTCTLDHPGALDFYQRSGFRVERQQVEIAADPRLDGRLPTSAGRHVPLIR